MKTFFCSKKANQSGFAIILVMGLLLVAAAIAATMVARQENETTWAPIKGTQTQLASVQEALIAYQRKNHRLPLPANRANVGRLHVQTDVLGAVLDPVIPGAAKDALKVEGVTMVEVDAGIAIVVNPGDPAGSEVVVGAIPTEDLGLPRSAAEDKNGRLLTYAVTLAAANPHTFETAEGVIDLQDAAGTLVAENQSFLIISHGKDGAGAYNAKSRFRGRDCSGGMNSAPVSQKNGEGTLDAGETPNSHTPVSDFGNCDENDATFIVNDVNLVAGNSFFDDQMIKGDKDKRALSMSRPCAPGTVNWGVDDACTAVIPAPGLMHNGSALDPRSLDLVNTSPGATGTVTVQCDNGTIVKTDEVCTVNNNACPLPWGGTINVGDSVEAFAAGSVPCGAGCASETRDCIDNGDGTTTLTGGNIHETCIPQSCATTCDLPWGGTINVGDSVEAYTSDTYPCGAPGPAQEMRECVDNGNGTTTLTGSYPFGSTQSVPNPCPTTCDLPWGGTINHGESVDAYMWQDCESKATCLSEKRICNFGVLSGSYTQQKDCRDHCAAPLNCALPWGGTINVGDFVEAYTSDTYPCGAPGPAQEMRECVDNGNGTTTLTGSYSFGSTQSVPNPCPVGTGCTTPWGSSVADGVTVTAYKDMPCSGLCGAESDCCEAQSRACNLGQWVQTSCVGGGAEADKCSPAPFGAGFSLETCPYVDTTAKNGTPPRICPLPAASCNLPWGGTLASGQSVSAYSASSVACGADCPAPTTRTCTNGTLSGSGNFASCSVASCAASCALPWGGTLASGQSVQAFSTASVTCGNSCPASTTRTCTNGTLSGSGNFASCSVAACANASCTLDGVTVTHGQGRTFYDTASPACGSCNGEWRICNNGTLSGSAWYNRASCTDGPACSDGSCTGPDGSNIANGATKRYSDPNSGVCNCLTEDRLCTNGVLGGSAAYTATACAKILCKCEFGTDGFGNPGHVSIGDSVTAYQASSVPNGSSCTSQTRTCNAVYGGHPVLSGSYAHESCTVEPPAVCDAAAYWAGGGTCPNPFNFYWGPMPDGSSACLAMCPPQPCANPFGGTVASGSSMTSYSANSVAHGGSCDSVAVYSSCFNGNLSPAPAAHASCTVAAPPANNPCANPFGGTVAHGGSLTSYNRASGAACQCMESRVVSVCNNGTFSEAPAGNQNCAINGLPCP